MRPRTEFRILLLVNNAVVSSSNLVKLSFSLLYYCFVGTSSLGESAGLFRQSKDAVHDPKMDWYIRTSFTNFLGRLHRSSLSIAGHTDSRKHKNMACLGSWDMSNTGKKNKYKHKVMKHTESLCGNFESNCVHKIIRI